MATAATADPKPVALFFAPNSPAWLIARYAVHFFGCPVVHLRSENARSDEQALASPAQIRILDQTRCSLVLVDADTQEAAQKLHSARTRRQIMLIPSGGTSTVARISPATPPPPRAAVFDLTSGSSAQPKIVRHSFSGWSRRQSRSIQSSGITAAPELLVVTPLSHSAATMVDATILVGGRVRIHRRFDSTEVLHSLVHDRISDLYLAVPQLYELVSLMQDSRITIRDLPQLRQLLYSGTPAAPDRIRQARELFGRTLMQLYGSTEAGGMTSLTPADHEEPELLGTVGRPFSWVELTIRDDGGKPVPRGHRGEVCVRSPTSMQGYQDSNSACPWWPNGWLRTGDLGYFSEFDYLTLVARVGNVVKTGGLKILPLTVERELLAHPLVRQAVVYPSRDHEFQESLHAAIEVHQAKPDTELQLRRYLAEQLSEHHVPHKLKVMAVLPRTATGKIDISRLP